ncbi:MAG: hypothetical protein AAF220_09205, partial [Pseudomonadota bacterium]
MVGIKTEPAPIGPRDTGSRDWESHPPLVHPPYKSTILRGPTQPLVPLQQTMSEMTGPQFGADFVTELAAHFIVQVFSDPVSFFFLPIEHGVVHLQFLFFEGFFELHVFLFFLMLCFDRLLPARIGHDPCYQDSNDQDASV